MKSESRVRRLFCAALAASVLLPLIAGCGPTPASEAQDQAKVEKLKQDKLKSDK